TLLFGGVAHLLRPLRSDDEQRLIDFFRSHNEDTIRLRYGYYFKEMTPDRARALVGVDQTRDVALGIFSETGVDECLDAIGRCFILPDGRSAEVAFVVRETKRRLGMASTLLRALADIARERGLERLVAQVQKGNTGMLALFRAEAAQFEYPPGDSV